MRDEYRTDFDGGRGGWGKMIQQKVAASAGLTNWISINTLNTINVPWNPNFWGPISVCIFCQKKNKQTKNKTNKSPSQRKLTELMIILHLSSFFYWPASFKPSIKNVLYFFHFDSSYWLLCILNRWFIFFQIFYIFKTSCQKWDYRSSTQYSLFC